jgi:hypothetical protein
MENDLFEDKEWEEDDQEIEGYQCTADTNMATMKDEHIIQELG